MMQITLNETTASLRRIPFVLVDTLGDFVTGETFTGAEFQVSKDGAAFANAAGTVTELGAGGYYYEAAAAEVDTLGFLLVKFAKGSIRTAFSQAQVINAVTAAPSAATVAAAVLAEAVEGSRTLKQTLTGLWAGVLAKVSGFDTDTLVFRDAADTKNRITVVTAATGRTSITIHDLD